LLKIIYYLTGGRPMKFVDDLFMDVVTGYFVDLYKDRRGRYWMAHGPWALWRLPHVGLS